MSEPLDIAVFGAGIAGLTAAHELSALGHRVRVYEAAAEAGGFFRSARLAENAGRPSEYSWHGFGPWYHNAFDLLRTISSDKERTVFDRELSRPIDFGIFPDHGPARFYDRGLRSIPRMFQMSALDCVRWGWLLLRTWTSNQRTLQVYARQNAAARWAAVMRPRTARLWRSCFGPWIGSDWKKVSLHTAGQFFRKQLITRPRLRHPADEEGPAWTHGARDGWLLLRGPSSEVWFDPWLRQLQRRNVAFVWKDGLQKLNGDGTRIRSAVLSSGVAVEADRYVLAIDPFAAAQVIERTEALQTDPVLRCFKPLIQDGPHFQVSLRIAFSERIALPRRRMAVVVAESEFDLTLFAQEQAWRPDIPRGKDAASLWTVTACVSSIPGPLHHRPLERCTREEFIEELLAQIRRCGALDKELRKANQGRGFDDFPIASVEIWHEWIFGREGLHGGRPKWVNTTDTQPWMPPQTTAIPNLFLAGAHTRTEADVWSIEGAVESGRRAAQAIDRRVPVLPQYRPRWMRFLARVDDLCFRLGAPHVLDLCLMGALSLSGAVGWRKRKSLRRRPSHRPILSAAISAWQ